jgi:hypothetical protein
MRGARRVWKCRLFEGGGGEYLGGWEGRGALVIVEIWFTFSETIEDRIANIQGLGAFVFFLVALCFAG